jgi:hypothetical protein
MEGERKYKLYDGEGVGVQNIMEEEGGWSPRSA